WCRTGSRWPGRRGWRQWRSRRGRNRPDPLPSVNGTDLAGLGSGGFMVTRLIAGTVLLAGSAAALSSASAQSRTDLAVVPDGEIVRVTGCIVREDDYARAVGEAPAPADALLPVQLVLSRDTGPAYSLTGTRESELSAHVGRRVELT